MSRKEVDTRHGEYVHSLHELYIREIKRQLAEVTDVQAALKLIREHNALAASLKDEEQHSYHQWFANEAIVRAKDLGATHDQVYQAIHDLSKGR